MRNDMNPRAVALPADMIDHCTELGGCFRRAAERRMSSGRSVHLAGPRRAAKAREIEGPDIEAVAMQMIGP